MAYTTLHHNELFYRICQARGVKILMFRESYLRDRWIIASNDYSIDHTEYDVKHNFGSLSEIQNSIKKDAAAYWLDPSVANTSGHTIHKPRIMGYHRGGLTVMKPP